MGDEFQESSFREISYRDVEAEGNLIKGDKAKIIGIAKITVEEDSHGGVKLILKKDANDNIREIKFVCSCGETKSVILDYNEE